jgi:carboxyl-terminal processing protease
MTITKKRLDVWDYMLVLSGFFWAFQLYSFFASSPQSLKYIANPGLVGCLQKVERDSLEPLPVRNNYKTCKDIIQALNDEHAKYFTVEEQKSFELFRTSESKQIGFEGMVIAKEGDKFKYSVKGIILNSGAAKAGLKPGDIIKSVNGKQSDSLNPQQFYEALFENSDQVVLEIQNASTIKTYTIVKQLVKIDNVTASIKDNFGLIKVKGFAFDTYKEIVEEAKPMLSNPAVDTIVLDLRDNGGGLTTEGINVTSAFVPKGSLFGTEVNRSSRREIRTTNDPIFQGKKIIIALNGNSASASEMAAIAIEDNLKDKVTLIGTKSYGKGTQQVAHRFWGGDGMKFTVAKILNPSGKSHDLVGIIPEVPKDLKGDLFDKPNLEFLKTLK